MQYSSMTPKNRMKKILEILSKEYPDVKIQLNYENTFDLLVATILSAQCTDARVNIVTEQLYKKYHSPQDYIDADSEELEHDIFSTGFYKAKAKKIKGAAKAVLERFNGVVPSNLDDLLTLPGVGRKTANVILGHCFNTPAIVVDTHVLRISQRLGFCDNSDPYKIEMTLGELIPQKQWVVFTHYFINHGRNTCTSRKAKCESCIISELCPKIL